MARRKKRLESQGSFLDGPAPIARGRGIQPEDAVPAGMVRVGADVVPEAYARSRGFLPPVSNPNPPNSRTAAGERVMVDRMNQLVEERKGQPSIEKFEAADRALTGAEDTGPVGVESGEYVAQMPNGETIGRHFLPSGNTDPRFRSVGEINEPTAPQARQYNPITRSYDDVGTGRFLRDSPSKRGKYAGSGIIGRDPEQPFYRGAPDPGAATEALAGQRERQGATIEEQQEIAGRGRVDELREDEQQQQRDLLETQGDVERDVAVAKAIGGDRIAMREIAAKMQMARENGDRKTQMEITRDILAALMYENHKPMRDMTFQEELESILGATNAAMRGAAGRDVDPGIVRSGVAAGDVDGDGQPNTAADVKAAQTQIAQIQHTLVAGQYKGQPLTTEQRKKLEGQLATLRKIKPLVTSST